MSESNPHTNNGPLHPELEGFDPTRETFADTENMTSLWLYRADAIPADYFTTEEGEAKQRLITYLFEQLDPNLGPVNMGVQSVVSGLAADAARAEERYLTSGGDINSTPGFVNDSTRDDLKGLLDIFVAGQATKN
jgi:hypothetical protein